MSNDLVVAQKVDSTIYKVVDTVSGSRPVAVYGFVDAVWVKTEFEGALLVCERTASPPTCVIVLNQLKPENFVAYVDSGTVLQRKNEYLLYKNASTNDVNAIWFSDEANCIRILALLKKMVNRPVVFNEKTVQSPENVFPRLTSQEPTATSTPPGQDVLALLKNAEKRFASQATANSNAVPSAPPSSAVDALFKKHASGPIGAAIPSTAINNTEIGSAFVPLLGRGNIQGGNMNKVSNDSTKNQNAAVPVSPGENAQGTGFGIGKGRGRASNEMPRRGPQMIPGGPIMPTISPSSSPRASADVQEQLLTPGDFASLSIRESGDYLSSMTPGHRPGSGHQRHASSNNSVIPPSPNLVVGQSILSQEQFRQCFIYMLEHNQEFVKRLFDLFVNESGKGGTGDTYNV